jgi:hypothetical protein
MKGSWRVVAPDNHPPRTSVLEVTNASAEDEPVSRGGSPAVVAAQWQTVPFAGTVPCSR